MDSPIFGPSLCEFITLTDTFETYLQFQPDGGIPVTIGRIDWGWSCWAIENNGIWTWATPTSGPTPDWNDDSFPVWTQVYH
jgi:hypothetical protein